MLRAAQPPHVCEGSICGSIKERKKSKNASEAVSRMMSRGSGPSVSSGTNMFGMYIYCTKSTYTA